MPDKRTTLLILLASPLLALWVTACGPASTTGSASASGSGGGSVVTSSGSSGIYTVQSGDTLAGIAKQHGTTVQVLADANKATYPSLVTHPGLINVGWVLVIPGGQRRASAQSGGDPANAPGALAPGRAQFGVAVAEQEIFRLVNEERAKAGLHPLEWDPVLAEVARIRSQDMVDRRYFSHYDPMTGEFLAHKMFTERGYTAGGAENIAWDDAPHDHSAGTRVVAAWMHSSAGHRETMLCGEYHITGVGMGVYPDRSKAIITQVFLR